MLFRNTSTARQDTSHSPHQHPSCTFQIIRQRHHIQFRVRFYLETVAPEVFCRVNQHYNLRYLFMFTLRGVVKKQTHPFCHLGIRVSTVLHDGKRKEEKKKERRRVRGRIELEIGSRQLGLSRDTRTAFVSPSPQGYVNIYRNKKANRKNRGERDLV